MAVTVRAQWYDPHDRKLRDDRRLAVSRSGRRWFSVPGKNHDGADDWVLVLTARGGSAAVDATTER